MYVNPLGTGIFIQKLLEIDTKVMKSTLSAQTTVSEDFM